MKKNKRKVIKALFHWKIRDFKKTRKSTTFYLILYLILFSITTYGLLTDNLLLSILTILIGLTFFIFEKKEPIEVDFAITKKGVLVKDFLYDYDSLESFWIKYEINGIKEISFKTKQLFNPYLKISLKENNPSEVRKCLIKFLPEKEHKTALTDFIDEI